MARGAASQHVRNIGRLSTRHARVALVFTLSWQQCCRRACCSVAPAVPKVDGRFGRPAAAAGRTGSRTSSKPREPHRPARRGARRSARPARRAGRRDRRLAGQGRRPERLARRCCRTSCRTSPSTGTCPAARSAPRPLLGSATSVTDDLQREQLSRVAFNQGAGRATRCRRSSTISPPRPRRSRPARPSRPQLIDSLETRQTEGRRSPRSTSKTSPQAKAELGNLDRRGAGASCSRRGRRRPQARQAQTTTPAATPSRGGGAATGGTDPGSTGGGTGSGGTTPNAPSTPTPDPTPAPSIPAPSSVSGIAVNAASGQLGVPYRFAAESPGVAFDCSGLTKYAWGKAGVYLPHQSARAVRVHAARPQGPGAAGRPHLLLLAHRPRGHLHRRRADDPRPGIGRRRQGGARALEQGRRGLPAGVTPVTVSRHVDHRLRSCSAVRSACVAVTPPASTVSVLPPG